MKIFIFGVTGMLGRYVKTYFTSKGFEVVGISRSDIDIMDVNERSLRAKLFHMGMVEGDVVINCAGVIKSRGDISKMEFIKVNSLFPLMLADACDKDKAHLIHVTTDCVFNGLDGMYDEVFKHNPEDIYGKTKSLGEPINCSVIRTSIIGDEIGQSRSLIEWVKSNKDNTILGYTNHSWNGVTCLEFAKICENIINKKLYWLGVRHLYSPTYVSKFGLIQLISDAYDLNITITPHETPVKCDRTLSSMYYHGYDVPELSIQIKEQKEFYETLKNKK